MNSVVEIDTQDIDLLERLYTERFSCRGFRSEPVPRETIKRILQVAQNTASWCNSQPWQVVISSGRALESLRDALLGAANEPPEETDFDWPREYQGVYLARRRECGLALYESVGIEKGDREGARRQALENFRFFGAPHVAIVTTDEALGTYGAIDCGAYVNAFITAARAMGVSTIPQAALASRPHLVRRHLGLSDDRRLVCGISFGYADEGHPANGFRTRREDIEHVVEFRE